MPVKRHWRSATAPDLVLLTTCTPLGNDMFSATKLTSDPVTGPQEAVMPLGARSRSAVPEKESAPRLPDAAATSVPPGLTLESALAAVWTGARMVPSLLSEPDTGSMYTNGRDMAA